MSAVMLYMTIPVIVNEHDIEEEGVSSMVLEGLQRLYEGLSDGSVGVRTVSHVRAVDLIYGLHAVPPIEYELTDKARDYLTEDGAMKLTTAYAALRDVSKELADANDAFRRVRELHTEYDVQTVDTAGYPDEFTACNECGNRYPCPTITALDGSHE